MNLNSYISKIKRNGYVIVPNIFNKKKCNKLISKIKYLYDKNSDQSYNRPEKGQESIRDLILRDPKTFLHLISISKITKIVKKIFRQDFILDNLMASNSVKVENNYKAPIHIDSNLAVKDFSSTIDVVIMICCNDFTKTNGSTIVWKGSHNSGIRIQDHKNLLKKKHKYQKKKLIAKAGSAIICLGHLWHQVGKNEDGSDRWSVLVHYKRWWMKPATDFTKCHNKIFKMASLFEKSILGFNSLSPKFNFKTKKRRYYTLSKIEKIPKNYKKALNF